MDNEPHVDRARARSTLLRVVVASAMALALGAALAASDVRDLDLRNVRSVDASTVNGRIVVTIDPSASGVTVDHRGNVDYDVSVQGDTLRLQARNRALVCFNCEVSFEVRLAGPAALKLRSTNGNLTVTGAMTQVDAATTNGDVTTTRTATAPLDLATTNGRIAVNGARSEVRARNTNGSVELSDLTLPAGSASSARTTNGSVTLRGLASDAAMEITGSVSNGGVTVSLGEATVSYPDAHRFRATTTGQGSASLELRTVNGSLTVTR